MPTNANRDRVHAQRRTISPWVLVLTAIAIAATVIAFRRFASNERIAYAVAVGVARRRVEIAAPQPLTSESSPK